MTRLLLRLVPAAVASSLLLVWIVQSRGGDEVLLCETGRCSLGSGASWVLTGAAALTPFVALGGFMWSRRLHLADRLGPFSDRRIPDAEEILEGLAVVLAGFVSWWLVRNGWKIAAVDVGFPNDLLRGRLGIDDRRWTLVPTRSTWFLVGMVLSAPFGFSFGSMFGREWYGRERALRARS